MFCPNCGNQLPDNAKFCVNCGTSVNIITESAEPDSSPYVPPYEEPYEAPYEPAVPEYKPKKKLPLAIILIAAAALIAVLVFCFFGKSGYKDYNDLIDDYFKASSNADLKGVLELFHPKAIDVVATALGYDDYLQTLDYLDEWYSDGYYGRKAVSWTVESVEPADIDDIILFEGILGIDVERVLDVEVDVVFAGGDDECYDFDLISVDGRWYMIDIW